MSGHRPASQHGQATRFRARRLPIANGEVLVLGGDGTIERLDAAGKSVERWAVDGPGWADQALRFGVRASPRTVAPHGRDVPGNSSPA